MSLIKSSLVAGNGSVQTFLKDGLHVNSQPISEYILFETPSIAANTTKTWVFRDRDTAIILENIGFSPSASNSSAILAIRSGNASVYIISVPASSNFTDLPLIFVKPIYDLAIITPPGLTLNNLLIIAKPVYISDVIF